MGEKWRSTSGGRGFEIAVIPTVAPTSAAGPGPAEGRGHKSVERAAADNQSKALTADERRPGLNDRLRECRVHFPEE